MSYPLGLSILPGDQSVSQTSAGTTISDATALVADYVLVSSVTSGTGVKIKALEPKEVQMVFNGDSANALLVYPGSSSIQLNGATAGAALSLPAGKGAIFIGLNATNTGAIY